MWPGGNRNRTSNSESTHSTAIETPVLCSIPSAASSPILVFANNYCKQNLAKVQPVISWNGTWKTLNNSILQPYQEVLSKNDHGANQSPLQTIVTLGLVGFDVSTGGWTRARRAILTLDRFHT